MPAPQVEGKKKPAPAQLFSRAGLSRLRPNSTLPPTFSLTSSAGRVQPNGDKLVMFSRGIQRARTSLGGVNDSPCHPFPAAQFQINRPTAPPGRGGELKPNRTGLAFQPKPLHLLPVRLLTVRFDLEGARTLEP